MILSRPVSRIGVRIGFRASIFEFQVIRLDGGDVPHIFDVQEVSSGCCPLLHPDEDI
jgi:hypothetical protein